MKETLEEELLTKKEKTEKILQDTIAKIVNEKRWLKETEELKEGDELYEYKEDNIESWQRMIERDNLIAEALEEMICGIDQQLRKSTILQYEKAN